MSACAAIFETSVFDFQVFLAQTHMIGFVQTPGQEGPIEQ